MAYTKKFQIKLEMQDKLKGIILIIYYNIM